MKPFVPPTINPPEKPLGILASVRAVRRNVLSVIPAISFTQPIVTGTTGSARWHMVQSCEGLRRILLDNVENYPKSEVMIRMLRSAVGSSLFTSEGAQWRWQRRAIAPVFSSRNVRSLAPVMTETAERATTRIARASGPAEMVRAMLSATFDVICEVALSGREHFDADAYGAAITRYFLTVGKASLLDDLPEKVESMVGPARGSSAVCVEPAPDLCRGYSVQRFRSEGGQQLAGKDGSHASLG